MNSIEDNQKFVVKAPVIRDRKGEYRELLQDLKKQGYVRVEIDGIQYTLDEDIFVHILDVCIFVYVCIYMCMYI